MTGDITSPISPLRPNDPQRLGPYLLAGRIGRGGMGTVFLAVDQNDDRAAVKVINPDLADDDSFRDRFRREVESARKVRRFCTAPVLDAQLDGEPLYIVTEYVDGPNLEDIVDARGPLRGSNLEGLAVGVATALTAIHGAGVVHRDLKPANVLLSSVGPRVIDFGIARAFDTLAQATRTGMFIGTPSYMAPELVSGGRADPAADIFSWGCVMAFAGTGKVTFAGPTAPAVLYQVVHGEPYLEGLDPTLRRIVEQALAKDPAERPTAQLLLDRLLGQDHADTALGADTARGKWPADSVPERAATVVAQQPGAPEPTRPHTSPAADPTRPHPGPPPPPHRQPLQPPPRVAAPGDPYQAAGHGYPAAPAGPGAAAGGRRWKPWAIAGGVVAAVAGLATTGVLVFGGSEGPPEKTTSIFADDFADTTTNWPGGTYTSGSGYSQGGYRMDGRSFIPTQAQAAPYDRPVPERVLVTVDTRVLSGPAYGQLGIWCRGADDKPGYQFLVRADGQRATIRKVVGEAGARQLDQKPLTGDFNPKGKNRVQAACEKQGQGVRLRLWINGELTAENIDTDKPLPAGEAGLTVSREGGGSGGDLSVIFDDFDMSQIS